MTRIESVRFNDGTPDDGGMTLMSDKDAMSALRRGIRLMEKAKALEWDAKELTDKAATIRAEAEEALAPIHLAYGVRGVEGSEFGNLSFYYGMSSRFDKKVLQKELVSGGVKLDLVLADMTKATKQTQNQKLTIQLVPPKD